MGLASSPASKTLKLPGPGYSKRKRPTTEDEEEEDEEDEDEEEEERPAKRARNVFVVEEAEVSTAGGASEKPPRKKGKFGLKSAPSLSQPVKLVLHWLVACVFTPFSLHHPICPTICHRIRQPIHLLRIHRPLPRLPLKRERSAKSCFTQQLPRRRQKLQRKKLGKREWQVRKPSGKNR
jgi:hypothetical protein